MTVQNGPEDIFFNLTDGDDTALLSDTGRYDPTLLASLSGGIRALAGNDQVIGSSRNDLVYGNAGDDILRGFAGDDTLWGGVGSDYIVGDGQVNAGPGNDNLNGNRGNDLVTGGPGNDLVRGGQDQDSLTGDEGDDTLIGDFGQDTLLGGAGSDLFVLRRDTAVAPDANGSLAVDLILDFNPTEDVIGLTGGLPSEALQFVPVSFGTTTATAINFVDNDGVLKLSLIHSSEPTRPY